MLVVVAPDDAGDVTKILDKWDLHATVVGESTGDGDVSIMDGGREHGRLPVGLLTDAPTYRINGKKPQWLTDVQDFDLNQVPVPDQVPPANILLQPARFARTSPPSCPFTASTTTRSRPTPSSLPAGTPPSCASGARAQE